VRVFANAERRALLKLAEEASRGERERVAREPEAENNTQHEAGTNKNPHEVVLD
jgi:hypothetical protein